MTTPSSASKTTELTTQNDLAEVVLGANLIAARGAFAAYRAGKAANTLRRQAADLARFTGYLRSTGLQPGHFETDPEAWRGITWGWWRVLSADNCRRVTRWGRSTYG